jgi:hypothetical protein
MTLDPEQHLAAGRALAARWPRAGAASVGRCAHHGLRLELPQPRAPGRTPGAWDGLFEGEVPVTRDGYLTDILADAAIADLAAGDAARSSSACISTPSTGRGRVRATGGGPPS